MVCRVWEGGRYGGYYHTHTQVRPVSIVMKSTAVNWSYRRKLDASAATNILSRWQRELSGIVLGQPSCCYPVKHEESTQNNMVEGLGMELSW